jgi:hypothetical protein
VIKTFCHTFKISFSDFATELGLHAIDSPSSGLCRVLSARGLPSPGNFGCSLRHGVNFLSMEAMFMSIGPVSNTAVSIGAVLVEVIFVSIRAVSIAAVLVEVMFVSIEALLMVVMSMRKLREKMKGGKSSLGIKGIWSTYKYPISLITPLSGAWEGIVPPTGSLWG